MKSEVECYYCNEEVEEEEGGRDDWIREGGGLRVGVSDAAGESEDNESDWEVACCLLYAMRNQISNQAALHGCVWAYMSVYLCECVCARTLSLQRKLLSRNSTDKAN